MLNKIGNWLVENAVWIVIGLSVVSIAASVFNTGKKSIQDGYSQLDTKMQEAGQGQGGQ